MPTVHILQESKTQDFSDVKRFGDPRVIVIGKGADQVKNANLIYKELFTHWCSEADVLVPNGSPLGLIAAGVALRDLDLIKIPILSWNRHTLSYDLISWKLPT